MDGHAHLVADMLRNARDLLVDAPLTQRAHLICAGVAEQVTANCTTGVPAGLEQAGSPANRTAGASALQALVGNLSERNSISAVVAVNRAHPGAPIFFAYTTRGNSAVAVIFRRNGFSSAPTGICGCRPCACWCSMASTSSRMVAPVGVPLRISRCCSCRWCPRCWPCVKKVTKSLLFRMFAKCNNICRRPSAGSCQALVPRAAAELMPPSPNPSSSGVPAPLYKRSYSSGWCK